MNKAVFDKLTPGELTDGEHIAGTGTIAGDGAVGAIGGIVQKMYGAQNAGADWFLAPLANCDGGMNPTSSAASEARNPTTHMVTSNGARNPRG